MFTYTYTGAEPVDGAANTDGTCYYKKGTSQVYGGTLTVNGLVRLATAGSIPTSTPTAALSFGGSNGGLSTSVVNVASTSSPQLTTSVVSTSSVPPSASNAATASIPQLGSSIISSSIVSSVPPSSSAQLASSLTSNLIVPSSVSNAATTSILQSGTSTASIPGVSNVAITSSLQLASSLLSSLNVPSSTSNAVPSSAIQLSSSIPPSLSSTASVSVAPSASNSLSALALTSTLIQTSTTIPTPSSQVFSTSSASSSAACTLAPVPAVPVCPTANATSFIDSCGTNYTVYCGFDSNPGAASQASASTLLQCMQLCDGYAGCVAASLASGICYLKTGFSTIFGNSNVQTLVRYVPPNPAFSPPISGSSLSASSGCGLPLPGGLVNNGPSVLFNFINPTSGLLRNYTIHIPQYYDQNHASPVIFAFPGNGEAASNIEGETGLSNSALNPYAIVVYVNGYGLGFASNPNWGVPGTQYGFVDDIGFMRNLVPNITSSFCIDTTRIWATGHSNGGGFVNVMACDPVLSSIFTVFTANSAACYTNATSGDPDTIEPLNTPVQALCSPSRNNPFLEMHGTADGTIKYYGGSRNSKILPSIPHLMTDWAIRDGMSPNNVTTALSSLVTQYQFGNSSQNLGFVTQLTLGNWIHAWPTIATGAPIDGGPVIMNFFYAMSNHIIARGFDQQYSSVGLYDIAVFQFYRPSCYVEWYHNPTVITIDTQLDHATINTQRDVLGVRVTNYI
ncbi:hypothetical protein AMS68_001350 [Peltaster fructicola]|uniref:feruloyl esterase n=1 Tax=Peltaster fructicola TaxID=286661 RepID=A0A6H0XM90_9PEZI|nr:hypothetical protein AMS68_001350 [Peltaster fructicola]